MSAARRPTPARPTVVYLGGSGRSGSTLLERLLGAVPGVATLGEVVHLPARGLVEGERLRLRRAPRPLPVLGRRRSAGLRGVGPRRRSRVAGPPGPGRPQPPPAPPGRARRRRLPPRPHRARRAALERLYLAAAADDRGGRPGRLVQARVDGLRPAPPPPAVDLRFVHLVRDSRGVAYSWTKEVARPEVGAGADDAPLLAGLVGGLVGRLQRDARSGLAVAGTPVLRLRYEDLLADPVGALRAVLAPDRPPPRSRLGRLPRARRAPPRAQPLGGRQPHAVPPRHHRRCGATTPGATSCPGRTAAWSRP